MSEPFLERLNQFTPDPGRLNRDALLFAAGRSSARPSRPWQALAGLLAGTQALSLLLLLARPVPSTHGLSMPVAAVPAPAAVPQPSVTGPAPDPGIWSARHRLDELEPEDRPADALTLIDNEPPLRVLSPAPTSLAN
jgi:hypothetical protein